MKKSSHRAHSDMGRRKNDFLFIIRNKNYFRVFWDTLNYTHNLNIENIIFQQLFDYMLGILYLVNI